RSCSRCRACARLLSRRVGGLHLDARRARTDARRLLIGQDVRVAAEAGVARLWRTSLAFALPYALSVGACATFSEPVSVDVKNDLSQIVTLEICSSHDCNRTTDPWVLQPGQVGAVN